MMFFSNNKIEAFTSIDGVQNIAPITRLTDDLPDWIKNVRNDLKNNFSSNFFKRNTHLGKCPGIYEMYNYGFVIPMWFDLTIQTNGDKKNFTYAIPSDEIEKKLGMSPIEAHDETAKFIPYQDNQLELILKINTPWHLKVPKGLKFLISPVFYPEDDFFSATPGILDPSIASNIPIQLFWKKLYGSFTIKTGTPMMYLFPLTDKKYNLECKFANENQLSWINKLKYFQSCSFNYNRNKVKSLYQDHFK